MVNKQIDLFNESSSLFKRVDVYVHKSKDNKVYLKFVGWQNFPDSSLKEYIGFIPMKDRIFFVKQCKNSRSINDIFVRRSNVLFQWTEPVIAQYMKIRYGHTILIWGNKSYFIQRLPI